MPDGLTATTNEVIKNYTFLGANSDDEQIGTLALTGNAVGNHVTKGYSFYTTNPKMKYSGTMEVNSISSFNASLISGRQITAKWTNPIQGLGKPYSGVYIRYQTGSYPTPTTGTQIYKGTGSTTTAGAVSTVTLNMPSLSTTYYFICYSYCITSNGELLGTQLKATVTTKGIQVISIKESGNYTIPVGYTKADLFCVGGGGGGGGAGSSSTGYSVGGSGIVLIRLK